eukprot:TRINITY_DN11093_c0_g1_i1.p1 TRINITY_DN11093_c0_g1~~TRINITY_DN11093_c0_g1_i1.p1  ORF type:complete len:101 (-),score=3.42 TRINITY_DN11093_c0_g1_i1:56-358(-)
MRFIPVNDYGTIKTPDGKEVYASQLVDDYIREKLNLAPKDQIYTYIYYIHPELNKGTLGEFAENDKNEMGITHMGAYFWAWPYDQFPLIISLEKMGRERP